MMTEPLFGSEFNHRGCNLPRLLPVSPSGLMVQPGLPLSAAVTWRPPEASNGPHCGWINGISQGKQHPLRESNQEGKLIEQGIPVHREAIRLSVNPESISCKDNIFKISLSFFPSAFQIDFKTRLLKKFGNEKF